MRINGKRLLSSILALAMLLPYLYVPALAATCTVYGVELTYSSEESTAQLASGQQNNNGRATATWDEADKCFTLSATNSTHTVGWMVVVPYDKYAQNYKVTLPITNNTQNALRIQYRVAGEVDTHAVGSYTATLIPGQALKFELTSKENDAKSKSATTHTGYVYIDSVVALENVDVSFASSSRGNYSYQIAGSDAVVTMEKGAETTAAQVLTWGTEVTLTRGTPEEGYGFYGWMAGNRFLGTADGTFTMQDDSVVYPVYLPTAELGDVEPFKVGSNSHRLWITAVADSQVTGNAIVITRNYTLSADLEDAGLCAGYPNSDYVSCTNTGVSYKIPYGTTLLVPYNDANTLITNNMNQKGHYTEDGAAPEKVLYRQLTMASGAEIIVNGGISVGSQACSQMVGQVGPYGAIAMEEGSAITIKSGGNLYAYGYIIPGDNGAGVVTAEDGATVYESAFIMDYPGNATNTKDLYAAGVFPMRAYTVRNVEVPLTYYSGATEYAFYSLYGTAIGGEYPGYFKFIGSTEDSPFYLPSGTTLTKSYSNGKTNLLLNGSFTLNPLDITLKISLLGDYPVTSKDTSGFPLPSGYHLTLSGGGSLTLNDNLIMLEGTSFTVEQGASVNVNGKKVYIIDTDEDKGTVNKTDHYGKEYTLVEKDPVVDINGTININGGGVYTSAGKASVISSKGTGKVIIEEMDTTADQSVKVRYGGTGTQNEAIPVTPVYLQNADGSYTETGATYGIFDYADGKWTQRDHSLTSVVTAPTCEAKGYTTHTCSACGYVYTDSEVPATGHNMQQAAEAVAPTCETAGKTAVLTCANDCGKTEGGADVAALGHKDEGKDHTCDNGCGVYQGTHADSATDTDHVCDYGCGATLETCVDGDDNNHSCDICGDEGVSGHSWVDASCTAAKTCAVCGETEGEALSHSYDAVITAPTCTAKGYTTYTCSTCGDSYVADETEMVAHTPAEAVKENEKASTCTVAGSYDSVVYCSACNEELSRETKTLELAAHTEGAVVVENEKAATCTAEGSYDNVVYCTVCKAELSRNTVTVDKIAHTPAEAVVENRKESTCTVAGSYDSVVYCSACNAEQSRETKALELAAHTEGAVVVENEVAATCTAEGSYDNVVYCTVCNEELSRNTVTVEKIAHAYEAVVTAPTCTAKGYTTYTCSACGDSYVADEVAALGHTEVTDEAVEPDCTNTGLTEGSHCSVCDAVLVAQEIVPATGHVNTTTTTVDATCTEAGSVTVTCSCGEVVSTEIIPATGHTYGEPAWTWDLEAEPVTCTATFTCTVCAAPEEGANDIADRVVTEDCAVEEKNCTDATCGKDGSVVYTATVEFGDQTYANDSEAVTIPSTGEHSYVNGVCDVCGDQEVKLTQFIKSVSVDLGNSLALKFIIDPDLNDDGVLELTSNDNYAVISKLVNGTWTVVKESPQSEWDTYNNSRFVAVYDDIAAKNMADKFKIVLYNKFGEAISVEYEDTVRDYAKRGVISLSSLSNPTTKQLKQLTMFVDFLNYGAAAQVNFNYNTGDLANSVLTEEHQKYATPSASAENKRVGDGGTAVSVESRIELGFTFDKTLVTRDMYAVVSYTKHTGTLYNETILGADFEDYSNTKWRIPVFKLSTADGNQMITCTIYDAEGHQVAQAKDSINSYMARVLVSSKASANLKNLATAALKLTASAYAYFH